MKGFYAVALGALLAMTGCGTGNTPVSMEQWKAEGAAEYAIEDGVIMLGEGATLYYDGPGSGRGFRNFELSGYARTGEEATAGLWFHTDREGRGYEVLFHNGKMDGTRKTGSLSAVRNLYKSMAKDGDWFPFTIAVRGKNIAVQVSGSDVVCYTEPDAPYRTDEYRNRVLGKGNFALKGVEGAVAFRDLTLVPLDDGAVNPNDTIAAIDEQNDRVIRLQQENFPVIDYHVHLKGWSMEQAHARSMNYGINYGVAPNCGIGFPVTDDAGVRLFMDTTSHMPFFFAMQGEGREWVTTFSPESRRLFDYVFTDALTFRDHKGRRTRLWIPEETFVDIPHEQYMEVIVDRTVKVLEEEPIDIYVNPTMLPDVMAAEYDALWTQERIDRVVKALKNKGIALEINARYRIPNFQVIKTAKNAGVKFTFGTNNAVPDLGKLEYCFEAMDACGLTPDDFWFPTDRRGL